MFRALIASIVLSAGSSAFAQVMYQPVQYQFATGTGDQHYFYGGNDPRMHAVVQLGHGYANNMHNFDGGNSFGQPSPQSDSSDSHSQVFTDAIPYQNAARFGYTEADAHNEAYGNAARYFRKSDELAASVIQPDGSRTVPPTPVMITLTPLHPGSVAAHPVRSSSSRKHCSISH